MTSASLLFDLLEVALFLYLRMSIETSLETILLSTVDEISESGWPKASLI